MWRYSSGLVVSFGLLAPAVSAAELPEHSALNVVVVSDEVNPNGLGDAELTQPGDISAALNAGDSGLQLSADVREYDSQCIDDALRVLGSETVDVVVYFAHRGARACDGSDRSAEFLAAVSDLLAGDRGLVVFHHGLYFDPGKTQLLELIGAQSNSIAWDTSVGQRVINVAPGHFITSNALTYADSTAFALTGLVVSGDYEYFDNVPDERYPRTDLTEAAAANATILFATDAGGDRVLGYTLPGPGGMGRIFAYQPGEYQPNALDDRAGPNFQVLANGILFASGQASGATGDGVTGDDATDDDAAGDDATNPGQPGAQDDGAPPDPSGVDGGASPNPHTPTDTDVEPPTSTTDETPQSGNDDGSSPQTDDTSEGDDISSSDVSDDGRMGAADDSSASPGQGSSNSNDDAERVDSADAPQSDDVDPASTETTNDAATESASTADSSMSADDSDGGDSGCGIRRPQSVASWLLALGSAALLARRRKAKKNPAASN